ncbi:hypothetical protein AV654_20110 [Paenibacillus elgii]|uniref:Methyltransferase n=2 Tax=Paenibacillus elgii TaxID=189691 RepID=A0A163XJ84_9BACL|nr:hypothetical protein AV654_20110 [Paenibacillus elgii]
MNKIFNFDKFGLFSEISIEQFYLCNMTLNGRNRKIEIDSKEIDYIRLSSLELIASEIELNKTHGNVAELGVFRGDFSKYINKLFPERKLYLFDTFEGFDIKDIKIDIEKNYSSNHRGQFLNTDIELVMGKMLYPEQCIIRRGYFPGTAIGLEEQFALVSIDTDLYSPIYEGLKYFYPRLAQGGYIMIHDYNNNIYKGAKTAVRQFCSENKVSYVPLSDLGGTVVITK